MEYVFDARELRSCGAFHARLKETLPCDGFNILQNNGAAAGQTVNHLHFHIVPRVAGAGQGELSFANRPGDMGALKALAERLKMG